jgi:hypothetical protein
LVFTGCVDLKRPWDKWAPDAGKARDTATETAPIVPDGARPSTEDTSPPVEDAALPTEEDAPTPVIPDVDAAETDRPADAPLANDAGVDASLDTRADRMDAVAVDGRSDLAPKLDQRNFDSSETLGDARLDVPADSFALLDACVGCDRPVDAQDTDAPIDTAGPDLTGRDSGTDAIALNEGLIGHWTFDEGAGTKAEDSSGHGITGTLQNAPAWSVTCAPIRQGGSNPGCLHFDGSSQSVVMDNAAVANFAGPISIAAWVRTDEARSTSSGMPAFRNIMAHGFTTSPAAEVYLRLQNNAYSAGAYDGEDHQVVSDTGLDDVGVWVHVAAVYDGTTWYLFRQGTLVDTHEDPVGAIKVSQPWGVGATGSGNMRFFNGFIDDVRLYNRALKADEVAELAVGI